MWYGGSCSPTAEMPSQMRNNHADIHLMCRQGAKSEAQIARMIVDTCITRASSTTFAGLAASRDDTRMSF